MSEPQKVGYALTEDGYRIAYAVRGHGGLTHVFIAEGVSVVDDAQWEHPALVRFQRMYASLSQVVNIDLRSIGVSDFAPLDTCFTPSERAIDILAVLDALEIERAVLSGEGYAGHAVVQFAVSHPERTHRVALSNSYACLGRLDDDQIVPLSTGDLARVVEGFEKDWGTGRMSADAVPTFGSDASWLDYLAARERRSMSPTTAGAYGRTSWSSDIRDLLPRLTVPTLIYYTGDLAHVSVEHSRYLAEHIPGAILVEAPGRSFYDPLESERLNAWAEFIVGGPAALSHENKLLTLLFTDVVGSTEQAAQLGDARWTRIMGDLDAYVARRAADHGGRVVKQTGDGHLIAFDLPRDALGAACEIARGVDVFDLELRCGVHMAEVELLPDGDLRGIAVHAAARVCGAAAASEVLVSRTVADLAAGSDFEFEDRGPYQLKGVPGQWTLYAARTS